MKKRVLAAFLCAVLMVSVSACGKKEETTTEAQTKIETETQTTEPESTQSETPEKEIVLEEGLDSTDIEEVLAFYKLVAAKNKDKPYNKKLDLISIDGGEGRIIPRAVAVFEPVAKKAIAKNSVTDDPMPGDYQNIRPTDWEKAEAVNDGTYTTIKVRVKTQTDGADGSAFEGPVGRTMTVLDGIQTAMDELPGVSADFEHGRVEIEYQNPSMTVKIRNSTGEFVKGGCTWSYRVHPTLYHLDGKMLGITVPLKNATGYVDYIMTY